ncbi:G5 domain-containing protein [Kribbella sp. VKM Ac-2566]|uniref:G5 domain-containing protein n=1 Tax=Kribbella sp. VKM Ac-2566 TaxID=2512218 RepID=UPI00192D4545|nr:G5 domain-containing protein [Kribbella sp. VKM Ac-2566]
MLLVRAALGSVAVVALVGACGADSGTSGVGEPAAIASVQVSVTPTPASTAGPGAISAPVVTPTRSRSPKASVTTTKEVVELRVIPFKKKTVTDDSLAKGERTIRTAGVNGTRRLVYRVTYVNGVQTGRRLVRQEVAKEPRSQVTAVGTKVEEPEQSGGCDPNYSGCVPIASDVDCSGGSGNGPEYVDGPIDVVGSDIYRLDADDDGIACE